VIVVLHVIFGLGAAPGFIVTLEKLSLVDGKGWNPDPGQRKMVGAVVVAGSRRGVRQQGQVKGLGHGLDCRPEVDALGSAQVHRPRNSDGQQHIEVQIQRNFRRWNRGVHAQELRAEQALLFGSHGRKIDRVRRTYTRLGKSPRQFQQNPAAGSVVSRAVVDVVALGVGIDSQMVVMGGIKYGLAIPI